MRRTLEMLVYGAVALMQLVVALFLLDHLPGTGHARPAPPPAPARSSLFDRAHLEAGRAPGGLRT